MKIPEGYHVVTPYLIIKDASRFLSFTKDLFDAKELGTIYTNEKTVMHGEIKIADSVIMFADCPDERSPQPAGLFIYVENTDEAYRHALELGASSVREPSDQSYGRSAGVLDPCGNTWWITAA